MRTSLDEWQRNNGSIDIDRYRQFESQYDEIDHKDMRKFLSFHHEQTQERQSSIEVAIVMLEKVQGITILPEFIRKCEDIEDTDRGRRVKWSVKTQRVSEDELGQLQDEYGAMENGHTSEDRM